MKRLSRQFISSKLSMVRVYFVLDLKSLCKRNLSRSFQFLCRGNLETWECGSNFVSLLIVQNEYLSLTLFQCQTTLRDQFRRWEKYLSSWLCLMLVWRLFLWMVPYLFSYPNPSVRANIGKYFFEARLSINWSRFTWASCRDVKENKLSTIEWQIQLWKKHCRLRVWEDPEGFFLLAMPVISSALAFLHICILKNISRNDSRKEWLLVGEQT